jgi:peptidoglycan-N-acetylglucosamine deacetylase
MNDSKNLIVTTSWDDGSKWDEKLADLLDRYNLKGTFYIPRSYLENSLNANQVKNLDSKFEIGAHTLNHLVLPSLSVNEAKDEIEGSKVWLQELLGHDVTMFCYPKGRVNRIVKDLVRNSGFKAARTCDYGDFKIPSDPFEWQISLHASDGSPRLNLKTWYKSRISITSLLDWEIRARLLFNTALRSGGIYHLWGHSWEIEKSKEWKKLERVFKYISARAHVTYASNGEIFK